MQVPTDFPELDQLWKLACCRGCNFPSILPKLRRDEWESHLIVDAFFCVPRYVLGASEDAVLIDLEPALQPELADGDVVRL